jgi:hypothetical protein
MKQTVIGFSDEWQAFFERHPLWSVKFKLLHTTSEKFFIRTFQPRDAADSVIFFMGRLCIEDFNEIFLLCGNGYGFGALKILRGLYERAVTSGYIAKNPDQAEPFLEYHHIHKGKMLKHAKKFFAEIENLVDLEEINNAEKLYKKYKDKFQEPLCKRCNKYRTRLSWSSLDLLSMAKKVDMEELYFPGYYYPTLHTHTTATSIISRVKAKADGGMSFIERSQRDWSDKALITAHNILIRVLLIQNTYFDLRLDDELGQRKDDFVEIWDAKES